MGAQATSAGDAGPGEAAELTYELRPAQDILEIDAVSFATRAGQVAAAEIFMLLEGMDPLHATIWYMSGLPRAAFDNAEFGRIEADVHALGAYVCDKRTGDGERLRNYAEGQGMPVDIRPWVEVPVSVNMAYFLFAQTCLAVFNRLDLVQSAERAARAIEAAPENPPLKREDSIFEEQDSLGDLIPGVLEQLAASDAQRAKEADYNDRMASRRKRDAALAGEGWETKRQPKPGRKFPIGAPDTD